MNRKGDKSLIVGLDIGTSRSPRWSASIRQAIPSK
jgi:hypothetical protein